MLQLFLVRCTISPGVGANLVFQVFIGSTIFLYRFSYPIPILGSTVALLNSNDFKTALQSSTTQGESIEFNGQNFGKHF